ncbi:MAG: 2-C-methyl-D-erythritol 2,4-cyclodiphosphate synthase [Christensenellales bacterium]
MNAAVIVAAGRGTRMGLERNKVLAPLCGEPVIARTVRAFEQTGWFDGGIVVVTGACDADEMKRILAGGGLHAQVVLGGADRQESVCRGLAATNPEADYVAIHDGARPLVTADVIARTLESAKNTAAAWRRCAQGYGEARERRRRGGRYPAARLRAVQTPQTFEAGLIRKAHAAYALGERATDDAALAERMGVAVHLTEGDVENIKLTTPEDMLLARQVILKREGQKEEKPMMRIGHGYDVHRLVENRKLILCGVEIPYALGLLGHSDADVALHALMDALLGAAALGDIGRHFPDTDPAYKGADSGKLLDHVVALLEEKGYTVGNVDVTIICQRPKLKDYIEQMRENVARHLKVERTA